MGIAVLLTAILLGALVWVFAVVDLINATEMEQTGRLILAGAVIVVPPLGLLIWMGVRGGRVGALAAACIAMIVFAVAVTVLAAVPGRVSFGVNTQQVQVSGGSFSGGGQGIP